MAAIKPFRPQDFNTLLLTHGVSHRLGGALNSNLIVPYAFDLLRKWETFREHEGMYRLSPQATTKLGAIIIVLSAMVQRERIDAGTPYDTIHCETACLIREKDLPEEGFLLHHVLKLAYERTAAAEALYDAILDRGYSDVRLLKQIIENRSALNAAML